MRCEDLMTQNLVVVEPGDTVLDAARKMRDMNVGFLPVCEPSGTVVGTLTDRDIVVRVVAGNHKPQTAVEDVMSTNLVSCRPQDDLRRAEELMRSNQVERVLCIGDDGHLAGVISLADIAQYEPEGRAGAILADIKGREAEVH